MLDKLRALERQYEALAQQLSNPEIITEQEKYLKAVKAYHDVEEIVEKYRRYKHLCRVTEETKQFLAEQSEEELIRMAREELRHLEHQRDQCEEDLKAALLPQDPNDQKNVVLEIRAGAGGNEATLFAQEIFRMYSRYVESHGWKVEVLSAHYSPIGGLKEIISLVEGKNVYSRLKYESGVHRVQRVPETEAQGRLHTSAVTVAVLPEAGEVEVQIDPKDLRIDTYCSSGPGGQSVNTTYSAVRIAHLPSGQVVTCQDEKSQLKNKAKALKVLRSRLHDQAREEQQDKIAHSRRVLVGTGDRSEKIRTYNFPQNRVTDHRIGLTLHRLDTIMEGGLAEIVNALIASDRAEALAQPATPETTEEDRGR